MVKLLPTETIHHDDHYAVCAQLGMTPAKKMASREKMSFLI